MRARMIRWRLRLERLLQARKKSGQEVILYLADKLRQELDAAGYDTKGTDPDVNYVTIFQWQGETHVTGNKDWRIRGKV